MEIKRLVLKVSCFASKVMSGFDWTADMGAMYDVRSCSANARALGSSDGAFMMFYTRLWLMKCYEMREVSKSLSRQKRYKQRSVSEVENTLWQIGNKNWAEQSLHVWATEILSSISRTVHSLPADCGVTGGHRAQTPTKLSIDDCVPSFNLAFGNDAHCSCCSWFLDVLLSLSTISRQRRYTTHHTHIDIFCSPAFLNLRLILW